MRCKRTPILKEQSMVAELAELFVSFIYILGLVMLGCIIINIAMATITRIIASIVEALAGDKDDG